MWLDQKAETVLFLGLDIGSTTTRLLIMEAEISPPVQGRQTDLRHFKIIYQSPVVFTPFQDEMIDETEISCLVKQWLKDSSLHREITSASVIVTGLASRKENAQKIKSILETIVQPVMVASLEDPNLESWMAYLGSCSEIKYKYPEQLFLNVDIGGGTSNFALGLGDKVCHLGCYFIGTRHWVFAPDSFRLISMSDIGKKILQVLGVRKSLGDYLGEKEVSLLTQALVSSLESIVLGKGDDLLLSRIAELTQIPYLVGKTASRLLFSGGVGELIYAEDRWKSRTPFGDLGLELARALRNSPVFFDDIKSYRPSNGGRATVFGLTTRQIHFAGNTVFLPRPELLPLIAVPILGDLSYQNLAQDWERILPLLSSTQSSLAIRIHPPIKGLSLRQMAQDLKVRFLEIDREQKRPVLLLFERDVAKVFGNYLTHWGKEKLNIVAVDQLQTAKASFVSLGEPINDSIPVSLYGLR